MFKKSFANRLILSFTLVVFIGFLAVYFLFNSLIDTHIRAEAEAELSREITTVAQYEFIPTLPILEFNNSDQTEGWAIIRSHRVTSNRAIVNVNSIIIDQQGIIIHPNPNSLSVFEIEQIQALANFWNDNQNHFETSDDMMMTTHEGHTFYMRATSHFLFQPNLLFMESAPVSVLIYTDITPAMNLKNSMNQVLLALLATSGTATLTISIILSTRFKKSIKRLKNHAQIIGQGQFEQKITEFNDAEFNDLATSMNNMAEMLGTYEMNQKQFFQNASHELRTPLMSIQGYAEGLQLGIFDQPSEATNIIQQESKKMTELINDILYLSKLGTTNTELTLTHTSIDLLITNCIERVEILAEKANKKIITNITTNIKFKTDKDKLERAIINILANAIRYAQKEIHLTYTAKSTNLKIIIYNDGSKIDPKDLPHLFDRFYKGHLGNTGLGLAITKDIITSLKGTVRGENLESGVQFIIELPI